jgi:hypothetical protein
MTGAFVAATVVALVQYLRVKDWRILLVLAMLLFQAVALSLEWWSVWTHVSQGAVCVAGLALLLALSPRHAPAQQSHAAERPPRDAT